MTKPRITLLPLAALVLALSACTGNSTGEPAVVQSAPGAQAAQTTDAASQLATYRWHLRNATDAQCAPIRALLDTPGRMLMLQFADGRVVFGNGCNSISGAATVTGDTLTIGQLIGTQMACEPALMAVDEAASNALQGALQMELGNGPALTLTNAAGDVLLFEGEPTDATRYGSEGETVFLEVAAQTQPCHHPLTPNKQCLQVREVQFDDNGVRTGNAGEFSHFYDVIQDFQHEAGTRNVLRVKRYAIANPPADGASHAWVLDMVVESAIEGR